MKSVVPIASDNSSIRIPVLLSHAADPNSGTIKFMQSKTMSIPVPLLIEHGWDINEGEGVRTLLHHDASHGHAKKVRIRFDHGADPNVRDAAGQTALHLIASRGAGKEAIHALIRAGADLNARDHLAQTPLDLARQAKQQTAARKLVALGADASEKTRISFKTP